MASKRRDKKKKGKDLATSDEARMADPVHSMPDAAPPGILGANGKPAPAPTGCSTTALPEDAAALPPSPIVPTGPFLVVRQVEALTVTQGGIELHPDAQNTPPEAHVLAVGPGRWNFGAGKDDKPVRVPMDFRRGDRIVFVKAMCPVIPPGMRDEFLIIHEDDIVARYPRREDG